MSYRRKAALKWVLCGVPAAVLTAASILQVVNGHAQVDLAIFDQALWSASRGEGLHSSLIGETLLGDHFSPGLLLFVPLYLVAATPIWLVVAQGVAILVAAIGIVGRIEPSLGPWRAALVGASLVVFPSVAWGLMFDAHAVAFAIPCALAAFWALEDEKPWAAALLGIAAAAFRIEAGAAILIAFGAIRGRARPRVVPAAVLLTYLAIAIVLDGRLGETSYWDIHYSHLGTSPGDALAHPFTIVRTLFSLEALGKALPWLMSSMFLAVLRPRLLIPGVVAALPVLLSQWPGTSHWYFHYGLAPTLLFSLAWIPVLKARPELGKFVIAGNVCWTLLLGPFISVAIGDGGAVVRSRVVESLEESPAACITEEIPHDAGVSAAQRAAALLAHREHLYVWPYPFAGVPQDLIPQRHRRLGEPSLATEIDYVIASHSEPAALPDDFVVEDQNDLYRRYARADIARPELDLCN